MVDVILGTLGTFKEEILGFIRKVIAMFAERRRRKNDNAAAKAHFEDLKSVTLSFKHIFDSTENPLVGFLVRLEDVPPELLSYNNRLNDYISRSYNHYTKRIKRFDGTLEDFELLADEFESVFYAYEDLFVKPLKKRKDDIAKNTLLKGKYNKFARDYEHLRRKYIDYGEIVNREYGRTVIRTDFEDVVTL